MLLSYSEGLDIWCWDDHVGEATIAWVLSLDAPDAPCQLHVTRLHTVISSNQVYAWVILSNCVVLSLIILAKLFLANLSSIFDDSLDLSVDIGIVFSCDRHTVLASIHTDIGPWITTARNIYKVIYWKYNQGTTARRVGLPFETQNVS